MCIRDSEWTPPHAKWFSGGRLNVAANCLDRHLKGARRNKAAIIFEGEPGDRRVYTYWDLAREVGRCANALKRLGITKGDRVAIYLPMVPEAAIAMLACTRIGAVHSVVFGGFSAEALRDRITDAQCSVLITADGGYRRGTVLPLKRFADEAIGVRLVEELAGAVGVGDEVGRGRKPALLAEERVELMVHGTRRVSEWWCERRARTSEVRRAAGCGTCKDQQSVDAAVCLAVCRICRERPP